MRWGLGLAWLLAAALFPQGAQAATITVTSLGDAIATGDGVTLREAITAINAGADVSDVVAVGPYGSDDTIVFAIPGAGVQKIVLTGSLTHVTRTVTIDGFTQPGAAFGAPLIEIDASKAIDVITLENVSNCLVRGLAINSAASDPSILGSVGLGIQIIGNSTANRIQGNFIGINAAGDTALLNFHGMQVTAPASGNIIGTDGDGIDDALEGNVVSGNRYVGIYILGSSNNRISGNKVGTNPQGTAAIPNGATGVYLDGGTGNLVGTDGDGISDDLERNILSGNSAGAGINGQDFSPTSTASGNRIAGNYIGTDVTGTVAIPNGLGVKLEGHGFVLDNIIGRTGTGVGDAARVNIISGNTGPGVRMSDPNTDHNRLSGNKIGTDAAGTGSLGNGGFGVLIQNGANFNTIGGTGDLANTIAFNAKGVVIGASAADASMGNVVSANSIYRNNGLGIDLGSDGVTINDSGDVDTGPNGLANFPVIDSALLIGGNLVVEGWSEPGTTVELFSASVDPSGFGQGQTFVASRVEGSADDLDATTSAYRPWIDPRARHGHGRDEPVSLRDPGSGGGRGHATDGHGHGSDGQHVRVQWSGAGCRWRIRPDIVTGGPAHVFASATLVYTTVVTNAGPDDAFGVAVADTAPPGLIFVSNSGDCTTPFPCALGLIPSGAGNARTITTTYEVPAAYAGPNPIVNNTNVSGVTADPQTGNNSSTVTTPFGSLFTANVEISKAGPAAATAGTTVVYTITVTNSGTTDATGVEVAEPTPLGLTFVGNGGACSTPFPCALGAVPAGESRVITTAFAVPSDYATPAVISNTATVTSTSADDNLPDNQSTRRRRLERPVRT